MQIKVSRLEYEYTDIGPLYVAQLYVGIDLGGGLGLPRSKYIYIYIYIVFIYFISIDRPLSKTLGPLLLNKPNWPHPNSNYPTQKFNKNNKNIHNGNCILAKKKEKRKTILLPKNQKIMCYQVLNLQLHLKMWLYTLKFFFKKKPLITKN